MTSVTYYLKESNMRVCTVIFVVVGSFEEKRCYHSCPQNGLIVQLLR